MLLKWFAESCSPEFANLEANGDNVEKFFVNGLLDAPDAADLEMNLNTAMAGTPSRPQELLIGNLERHVPVSPPASGPSVPSATGQEASAIQTGMPHPMNEEGISPLRSAPPSPRLDVEPDSQTNIQFPMDDEGTSSPRSLPVDGAAAMSPARASTPSDITPSSPSMPRPGGSLSPLSPLEDSESEDDAAPPAPAPQPAPPKVKASSRTPKQSHKFVSGAALTQAPAPKKRKREAVTTPPRRGMTLAMKEEELYWTTAFAHVAAAVSPFCYFMPPTSCFNSHQSPRWLMKLCLPPHTNASQ